MSIYVWYSPATDVTGKKLQESLEATGGTKKPATNKTTVLCWGTKTDEAMVLPNKVVLNHPDNIKMNRNKFKSLKAMEDGGCKVAKFTSDAKKIGTDQFPLPVIARRNYHQGGAGFWFCATNDAVMQAIKEGAQYFQAFIDIKNEYRLHVVDGKVIYAVKKVQRENLKEAFKTHYDEHIKNFAQKKNIAIDEATLNLALDRFARKFATGVDMIIRSNTKGWKFSKVNLKNLDINLAEEAVKAVKTLGLDYGAVDCCISKDGTPYVIECNTGPGLEGTSFTEWEKALKALVKKKTAPKAQPEVAQNVVANNPNENVAVNNAAAGAAVAAKQDKKTMLKNRANAIADLVDIADENELAALNTLMDKIGK